ncbi:helix-turn-helix domain-containing protein [Paraburkholderia bryophila]|uniref:Transcriptional regulator with XRE-family HTH domain n=1 Tax=Paraburkholderia bryophila TaxID=420952 RepID=A0A7Y9WMY1_9BURK|nr:helix-turn-helix transcriptional regulator [Paraburkholderia bryophila]NYH23832.1 transcriptional regulator with XRE-family HTH domain [Paraburkholderia bryophila]
MVYYANMQNGLSPGEVQALDYLRQAVALRTITQSEIAAATGVDQSQVSRILAGRIKRASANVSQLCRFASQVQGVATVDPARNMILMEALRIVWDGTVAHAEAIAQVILSLRHFKESR